ncbi:MAG: hypothetical protein ACI4ED_08545 [Suilimivivens sp.]
MKQRLKWDEIIGILFFLISMGMLMFSVFLCFSSDIWYDELFTMGLANQSCGDLISMTARDVHPPLYYLIVKLFLTGTAEGDYLHQVVIAKLVSCLPFFLCILFSLYKIRKNFGLLTAGLFSFLVISMPQMADYTVEIRMYGYALLFVTVGMVTACELLRESRLSRWILLTLCGLFASYTHYFACIAACMVYVCLFAGMCYRKKVKQMSKPYLLSSLTCIAGYLPWLLTVVTKQVGQVKENYWITPVSLRTLGGCVKFIFQPSFSNEKINNLLAVIFFILYVLAVMVSLFLMAKKKKEKAEEDEQKEKFLFAAGCILVLAGLVLFGIAASLMIRPIFVYRYMLPAMGVFWLAFAVLIGAWRERKAVLIPLLLFLTVIGIRNFRAFYGEEMWKKMQMDTAVSELSQIGSGDVLIYNFGQAQGVVSYYLSNDTYLWYENTEELIQEMFPCNHTLVEGEFSDEEGIARIKELLSQDKAVWFMGSGNAREEIIEKWKAEGIQAQEKANVMIERYWFNIYRLTERFD